MEKLKLEAIRKELPFKTHQVNLWWNVWSIVDKNRSLDFDVHLPTLGMNLQRPLCWTLQQNQMLILSVVKGIYIPKICALVDQSGDGKNLLERMDNYSYQIIDGKQRLNAILSFLRNEFPLTIDGVDYFFSDMDERLQWAVKGYSPVCEVAYYSKTDAISDADKIAWFEMINFAGTPQDAEHLASLKRSV